MGKLKGVIRVILRGSKGFKKVQRKHILNRFERV
jgi:hypothetical protein